MSAVRVTARLMLLAALPTLTGHGWWCVEGEVVSVTAGGWQGPEFLPTETAVVTAVGQDVQLECRVRSLGDKAVRQVVSVTAGGWQGPEFLPTETAVVTAVGQDVQLECRVRSLGDKAGREVVSVTEGWWQRPEFLPTETAVVTAVGQDVQLEYRVRSLADKAVREVVSVTAGGWQGPEFLPTETAVVTAVGQYVQLECRVRSLADKAVSWVRSQDLHILSHAGAVFTADARVSVKVAGATAGATAGAIAGTTTHSLLIQRLRASDAGRYECQLNTDPKMSLFYNLTVLDEPVPVAVIEASERVVHGVKGGAATLRCDARYDPPPQALPLPPLDIVWTRDGEPIDLQRPHGGVSRDSERWPWRAASRLTLADVAAADAGRYRCALAADHADRATADDYVQLYVDAESQMEAMQRDQSVDNAARARQSASRVVAFTALLLLALH